MLSSEELTYYSLHDLDLAYEAEFSSKSEFERFLKKVQDQAHLLTRLRFDGLKIKEGDAAELNSRLFDILDTKPIQHFNLDLKDTWLSKIIVTEITLAKLFKVLKAKKLGYFYLYCFPDMSNAI